MIGASGRRPRRIHILGSSGAGKTTIARQLGEALGIPVYHLDEIARVGGGRGPTRSEGERAALVAEIVRKQAWITEGIHLGWTEPLMASSDAIIWLDYATVALARRRVIGRFLRDAIAEARERRGRERFLRLRAYAAHLRGLLTHLRTMAPDEASGGSADPSSETRAATEKALKPYLDHVTRCTRREEVGAVMARLGGSKSAHDASGDDP